MTNRGDAMDRFVGALAGALLAAFGIVAVSGWALRRMERAAHNAVEALGDD